MIQIAENIEILDNLPDTNPDFIDALSRRNLSLISLSKFQNFISKAKCIYIHTHIHVQNCVLVKFIDFCGTVINRFMQ